MSIWPREILVEAIQAHREYAIDKPWMEKPRPLVVDVDTLEAMISEIDALKAERDAERERCAMLCEAHAGLHGTGAWVALTAAADRIRGLIA